MWQVVGYYLDYNRDNDFNSLIAKLFSFDSRRIKLSTIILVQRSLVSCSFWKREIESSNLSTKTKYAHLTQLVRVFGLYPNGPWFDPKSVYQHGHLAQQVEHQIEDLGRGGSNPSVSTIIWVRGKILVKLHQTVNLDSAGQGDGSIPS